MLIEEIKQIKSGKQDLRKFGITIGIIIGLLGGVLLWRGKSSYPYFFFIGAAVFLLGVAFPLLLKPIQKVWMIIAVLMGWIMTRVILIFLFYLIITPIGLLARICGNDFLSLKVNKKATSYWITRSTIKRVKSSYENQF